MGRLSELNRNHHARSTPAPSRTSAGEGRGGKRTSRSKPNGTWAGDPPFSWFAWASLRNVLGAKSGLSSPVGSQFCRMLGRFGRP